MKAKVTERHSTLKPLCPTRWLIRDKAIHGVLNQYSAVLTSLEEMASAPSDTGARANGLLDRFQQGKTVLGLMLAAEVTGELECLSKPLQNQTQTIAGMNAAVDCVRTMLQRQEISKSSRRCISRLWKWLTP